MDKEAVLEIIERFREALIEVGVEPAKMVLFGSYAGGHPHEGSDIDLVVISEDFAGKDHWERIVLMSDAIHKVWEPIEPVAMTPEEWENCDSLIALFARDGEVVAGSGA